MDPNFATSNWAYYLGPLSLSSNVSWQKYLVVLTLKIRSSPILGFRLFNFAIMAGLIIQFACSLTSHIRYCNSTDRGLTLPFTTRTTKLPDVMLVYLWHMLRSALLIGVVAGFAGCSVNATEEVRQDYLNVCPTYRV
jgi:hypothetical protein